jgi:excisionase family DNA binding protein
MALLSTKQAAELLGIPRRTVQDLIKRGEIRAVKFGRDWQIRAKDLTDFTPRKVGRPKEK